MGEGKEWTLWDSILLRLYVIVFGRKGVWKYFSRKIYSTLKKDNIPVIEYEDFLSEFLLIVNDIIRFHFYKLLSEEEKKELEEKGIKTNFSYFV